MRRCGGKLYASPRENTRRYVCMSGPDHGGCGRLTVSPSRSSSCMIEAVLQRLDSPELADCWPAARRRPGRGARRRSGRRPAQLDELAAMFGKQEISAGNGAPPGSRSSGAAGGEQRQLRPATRTDALTGLPGNGSALRGSGTR